MRIVVRLLLGVVATLTLLAALVVSFLAGAGVENMEMLAGRAVQPMFILMGATLFLGLLIAIRRRDAGWVAAFLVAILVAICAPFVAAVLDIVSTSPGALGSASSVPTWLLDLVQFAGTLLAALLGLTYSLAMREKATTGMETRP